MNAMLNLVSICLKALPVGTIREWSDGKYKKLQNGKWERVSEEKEKKEPFLISENASQSTNSIYQTYNVNGVNVKIRFSDHPSSIKIFEEGNDIELDLKDRYNKKKILEIVKDIGRQKYKDAIKLKRNGSTKNVMGFDEVIRKGDRIKINWHEEKKITPKVIQQKYMQLPKQEREKITIDEFKIKYLKNKEKETGKQYKDRHIKEWYDRIKKENSDFDKKFEDFKDEKLKDIRSPYNNEEIKDNEIIYLDKTPKTNEMSAKEFHRRYRNVIFE